MTNPVFGHATWNNGWTVGVGLYGVQNTDRNFVLFGLNSGKFSCITTANGIAYQSINVGNVNVHTLSGYFKKQDGSAITSADVGFYYNATLTGVTYTAIGNGWYRISKDTAGLNSSVPTGFILLAVGVTIYCAGFQIEEKAYATPLAYGDLLGCSWSGTAHASTSARVAAYARVVTTDLVNLAECTIRVVYRYSYNTFVALRRIFYNATAPATFRAFVLDTDDTLKTFVVAGYGTTDTTGVAVSAGAFMPVAATYSTYLVQVGANKVFGIIDNNFAYSGYTQALAVSPVGPDTGILMRPSYIFGSRVASAQKTIDIDYIRIWAERY